MSSTVAPSALQERPPPLRTLAILGAAALSFAMAQTSLIPAIGEIGRDFHADAADVAWTLTGYLAAAAVMTPVMGRLGDMFGKRRLLVVSLLAFAVGNVVSAAADSLSLVVAGRVVQGVGGGVVPLCFGIVRDEFPPGRVGASIGFISATTGVGGGLGLVMGGLLVDHASFHGIFLIAAGAAAAAAVAAQLLIPESPARRPGRVDVRGAVVFAVGLLLILLAIARANVWGWGSGTVTGLILAGLTVLVGWVQLERRTASPLADVTMLAQPRVLMTNVATLLTGFGMFGSFMLVPQLAEAPTSTGYGFGSSGTEAALLLLPGSLVILVIGPLSGVLGRTVGSKVSLAIGSLVAAVGLMSLGVAHATPGAVLGGCVLMFAGIGLAYAALPNLIVEAVPVEQTGEAMGFNTLVRSMGASLGSQVSGAILVASAPAGGLAAESGFRSAFALSAVVAGAAAALALMIPRGETGPAVAAEPAYELKG